MIISPTPRPTLNILHATNNAYKCVDMAYLFGQSEEDCNLYLKKLYWERDPEDTFVAPNFVPRHKTLFLIQENLAGVDLESKASLDTFYLPFRLYTHGGYEMKDELVRPHTYGQRMVEPKLSASTYGDNYEDRPESTEADWKWALTRSYFPPHYLRLMKAASTQAADRVGEADMERFNLLESTVVRLRFGEERKVYAVLFYRPLNGIIREEMECLLPESGPSQELQLLTLPEYAEEYELLFSTRTAADFQEPDRDILDKRSFGHYGGCGLSYYSSYNRLYEGGVPCVANLDTPVSVSEIYFRWQGQLTHFQLLDSPIIRPVGWTLAEYPEMKYDWPFLADKRGKENPAAWNPFAGASPEEIEAARAEIRKTVDDLEAQLQVMIDTGVGSIPSYYDDAGQLVSGASLIQAIRDQVAMHNARLAATWVSDHRQDFEFVGDLSSGIRFHPPCRWFPEGSSDDYYYYNYQNASNPLWRNPYKFIDFYSARCEWFGTGIQEQETEGSGDIWLLENWGWYPEGNNYGYGNSQEVIYNPDLFSPSISTWTETDEEGKTRHYCLRDVGDNKFYVANKALLAWYYSPETNSWKSNYGRPSTEDQMRLLVELPDVQMVRGCINPMSVPAIWNKPVFWLQNDYYSSGFTFDPKLYDEYLVPWHMLVEGRRENNPMTKWELMDEFTLEHFSARAHTYFSYPREVKFIRLTIQDWYGTTLMDDVRGDWFYEMPSGLGDCTPSDHWGEYSNIYAGLTVRKGYDYMIGRCLDERPTTQVQGMTLDFQAAHEEWKSWKAKVMQSLWKSIYIPPFLFFGAGGEP